MNATTRKTLIFYGLMALALALVGFLQSWSLSMTIFNYALIAAIMALGLNVQWGYAGLFNVGLMGFAALGGVAAVLVSMPPVPDAWEAGGNQLLNSNGVFYYYNPQDLNFRTWMTVPEPAGWTLLILGFMGVGTALRRRQPSMV